MVWFGVYFLSKIHKGVVGAWMRLFLEGVTPKLCEERAFGNEARCFEWAVVGD